MEVLVNHCWCSDSNWGGTYPCRVTVSICRVADGKSAYDPPSNDWADLIDENEDIYPSIYRLKPAVMKWLTENIKDRKPTRWAGRDGHKQGWAVGTDKYNANSGITFNIFFERQTDARKFIKRWSEYKRPLVWFNYFKSTKWIYDPKTKKINKE